MLLEVSRRCIDFHLRKRLHSYSRWHFANVHAYRLARWLIHRRSISSCYFLCHSHVLSPMQVHILKSCSLFWVTILEFLSFTTVHPIQALSSFNCMQFTLILSHRNRADIRWECFCHLLHLLHHRHFFWVDGLRSCCLLLHISSSLRQNTLYFQNLWIWHWSTAQQKLKLSFLLSDRACAGHFERFHAYSILQHRQIGR